MKASSLRSVFIASLIFFTNLGIAAYAKTKSRAPIALDKSDPKLVSARRLAIVSFGENRLTPRKIWSALADDFRTFLLDVLQFGVHSSTAYAFERASEVNE